MEAAHRSQVVLQQLWVQGDAGERDVLLCGKNARILVPCLLLRRVGFSFVLIN